MSDYTIEDLKDKYVETGTPESELFFAACEKAGVKPSSGYTFEFRFVEAKDIDDGDGVMLYGCYKEESLDPKSNPFVIKTKWTPQTNTMPLRDLSDEQAAQLFNAWRKNQEILERLDNIWHYVKPMQLSLRSIYHIKPKSERELFVEACVSTIKSHNLDDPSYYNGWFEQLFEAGCRFKDGE